MPRGEDGWLEAAAAWEVCQSLHERFAKGKDPFYRTRQADFKKHAEDARAGHQAKTDGVVIHLRKVAADYREMASRVVVPPASHFGRTAAWAERQGLLGKASLLEGQANAIEQGDLMS